MNKLIITARDLDGERFAKSALHSLGLNVKSSGFRAVLIAESDTDILEAAKKIMHTCYRDIGRAVGVIEEVESDDEKIKQKAIDVALAYIKENESFSFRIHKRGVHRIAKSTPELEYDVGGAIYTALEKKYQKKPIVNLKNPDITIIAEVLGESTCLGILRKDWILCNTNVDVKSSAEKLSVAEYRGKEKTI